MLMSQSGEYRSYLVINTFDKQWIRFFLPCLRVGINSPGECGGMTVVQEISGHREDIRSLVRKQGQHITGLMSFPHTSV